MLKELRKEAGLTQATLGKKMGYGSSQFISNIERGIANLPPSKFKKAAKLLKVPVSELVEMRIMADKARLMKRYGGVK